MLLRPNRGILTRVLCMEKGIAVEGLVAWSLVTLFGEFP